MAQLIRLGSCMSANGFWPSAKTNTHSIQMSTIYVMSVSTSTTGPARLNNRVIKVVIFPGFELSYDPFRPLVEENLRNEYD